MDTIPSLFAGSNNIEEGTRIADRYVVTGRLGAGGMGVVLKVADSKLHDEEVALKLLNPVHTGADKTTLQRMVNEVVVARSLTHPNIVRIHDIGETEQGCTYITMEYVKGQPLDEVVKGRGNQGLPMATTLKFLSEILEGVAYAHKKGVTHRDIKPANILLTDEGEIKVVDFGLARSSGTDMNLTKTGEAVGTPAFMAPEQFRGGEIDQRADVYALGIMAYQLATGNLPFNCETFFDMALKHMSTPMPSFGEERTNIPDWFDEIVRKAAAKKPEDRYQNATEFLAAIAEHSDQSAENVTRLLRLSGSDGERLESVYRLQSVHAEKNAAQNVAAAEEEKPASSRTALWVGLGSILILLAIGTGIWKNAKDSEEAQLLAAQKAKEVEVALVKEKEAAERAAKEAAEKKKAELTKALKSELNSYAAAIPLENMVLPEERKVEKPKASAPARKAATANGVVPAPTRTIAKAVTPPPNRARKQSKTRSGVDLLGADRKAYSGEMKPIGGSGKARTLTLDIAVSGASVSGTATINGYGSFDVVGEKTTRGYDMTLVGRGIEVQLNGGERKETLRGTYSIPKQNKNGAWKASLLR